MTRREPSREERQIISVSDKVIFIHRSGMYGSLRQIMVHGISVDIIITARMRMSLKPLERMNWITDTAFRKNRPGQPLHLYP